MQELKRMREERGWSQVRLAKESGVDRATINQVEGGHRSPTIATLGLLAEAMGVEIADFFPKVQASLWSGELPEGRPELSWETVVSHATIGTLMAQLWGTELEEREEAGDLEWLERITLIAMAHETVLNELLEHVTPPDKEAAEEVEFLAMKINAFSAKVLEVLPRVREKAKRTSAATADRTPR